MQEGDLHILEPRLRRVLILASVGLLSLLTHPAGGQQSKAEVTVYKSPACGCCRGWVEHMRRAGFTVKAQDVEDIQVVKTTYGLPLKLASCHTSLAGGYVLEGHIPAEVVERVLRERPKVAGLAVPGMPVGSPGMEQGSRRDPYDILAFDKQGKTSVYESRR